MNARVSIRSLDKVLASGVSPSADLCVVLPAEDREPEALNRFFAEGSDSTCAALVLPSASCRNGPTGGNGRLCNKREVLAERRNGDADLNADELAGRIKALCEIRHPLRKMREELRQLRQAHTQCFAPGIDEQLRIAGQIQNDLLPQPTADTAPLSVTTLYLPADYVSGDTYDITRLDEHCFGFSLADATGHGLPAALLAILVKNSLRGKEIVDGSYRIIEPDELLSRLNRELLAAHLQHCHFVTALHAIFDRTAGEIRWARGGMPYPVLFRPGQKPHQIRSSGGLIGAVDEQSFEVVRHSLAPGDLLLFYTDGLEAILLDRPNTYGDEAILRTDWMRQLADEGPDACFEQIRLLAASREPTDWPHDDITAFALRMN